MAPLSDPISRGAGTASDQSTLLRAAERVLEDLRTGADPDAQALAIVMRQMRRHAAAVFPGLDADDIVQSTIMRLLARSRHLTGTRIDNAWAYIMGATRYAALDAIRAQRRRREVALDAVSDSQSPDDAVAALLDRAATNAAVVAAFRNRIAAGDDVTVLIMTAWLDMAEAMG